MKTLESDTMNGGAGCKSIDVRPRRRLPHPATCGLIALLIAGGPAVRAAEQPEQNWFQLQIDKFRSYPHLHRAYGYLRQNRLPEAKKELLSYLAIEPADVDARLSLLSLLYRQRNFTAVHYQAARILVADPGNPTALLYQGLAAQAGGTKARALSLFQQVYSNPKAPPEARDLAANSAFAIAFDLKRFDKADEALNAMPAVRNTYAIQMRKGAVLAALKRQAEAGSWYESALRSATNAKQRAEAASALGYLAQRNGDLARTLSFGNAVLAIDPDNLGWLRSTADIRFGQKAYALAEQLARRVVLLTGDSHDRLYLANVLFAEQKFDDAAAEYAKVAEQAHDDRLAERANLSLGYTEQARNRPDAARQAFERAVALGRGSDAGKALAAMRVHRDQPTAMQAGTAALSLPVLIRQYRRFPSSYAAASLGYRYAQLGDAPAAANYFSKALKDHDNSRWRMALADQFVRSGDYRSAYDTLRLLRATGDDQRREAADIYRHIGKLADSAAYGEQLANPTDVDRLRLAEDYAALKSPSRALAQLAAIERTRDAGELGLPALRMAGFLYAQLGDDGRAMAAFRRALAAGDAEIGTRKALAYLLSKNDDRQAALDQYLAILEAEQTPENALAIGRMYATMNQNQQALSYYRSVLAATAEGDSQQRAKLNAEIGNVYEADQDYGAAYLHWQNAATLADSPELEMQLAYAEEMLGKPEQAKSRLNRLKIDGLVSTARLVLLDQFSRLNRAGGDIETAAKYTDMALAIEPNAARYYQRALDSLKMQEKQAGQANLEKAIELAPENADFALQLAYLHKQEGATDKAIPLFERALELDARRTAIYADLAYSYAETGRNEQALIWFRRAIDGNSAEPGAVQGDDAKLYGMRQQVRAMTQGYRFDVYQSYRPSSGNAVAAVVPGFVSGGAIPSQGGAELLYQPDKMGYDNGRILRFFGRTLWSNYPGSMRIDSRTVQGGVGVEYKPLSNSNVYVSAERLFPIGSQAQSNWLLRASWGYSNGYDMRPDQTSWNQTILYADAGYLAQHEKSRSVYFEARQGRVMKVGNAMMLTPHLTVAARGQRPDPFKVSYVEAGAGLSLKYLFNESRYSAPRSSLEFVVQYRKQISGSQHHGGWLFSAAAQF